jgi:hypothetical protein
LGGIQIPNEAPLLISKRKIRENPNNLKAILKLNKNKN